MRIKGAAMLQPMSRGWRLRLKGKAVRFTRQGNGLNQKELSNMTEHAWRRWGRNVGACVFASVKMGLNKINCVDVFDVPLLDSRDSRCTHLQVLIQQCFWEAAGDCGGRSHKVYRGALYYTLCQRSEGVAPLKAFSDVEL